MPSKPNSNLLPPPRTGDPFLDRQIAQLARATNQTKPLVKLPFSPPETLYEFIRAFWFVLEPNELFVEAKHLEVVCEHLEACSRGEIRKLIINIPPGFAKSLTCNVFWVARDWATNPSLRWLMVSYAQSLTLRDSLKCRNLIRSEAYQAMYGNVYQLSDDQNAKGFYETDKRGFRIAMPIDSSTGQRVDRLVIDDPHNTKKAQTEGLDNTELARAEEAYRRSLASRSTNQKKWVQVCMMQRLAERDLTGVLTDMGGWETLRLPMRFVAAVPSRTSIGGDWRTTEGELLWGEHKDEADVAELEQAMSARIAAAQLQQDPAPASGGVFERKWLRYWLPLEMAHFLEPRSKEDPSAEHVFLLPATMQDLAVGSGVDSMCQSWDSAITDSASSAYTCGQIWATLGSKRLLIDLVRGKWNLPRIILEVVAFSNTWRAATAKYVENKATGPAIMQTLTDNLTGLIPINPVGSKEARAISTQPLFEAGNVYLPHPRLYAWVGALVHEMLSFPRGAYADQVDTLTQALNKLRWAESGNGRLEKGGRSDRR